LFCEAVYSLGMAGVFWGLLGQRHLADARLAAAGCVCAACAMIGSAYLAAEDFEPRCRRS
jgi:hypothetical protein